MKGRNESGNVHDSLCSRALCRIPDPNSERTHGLDSRSTWMGKEGRNITSEELASPCVEGQPSPMHCRSRTLDLRCYWERERMDDECWHGGLALCNRGRRPLKRKASVLAARLCDRVVLFLRCLRRGGGDLGMKRIFCLLFALLFGPLVSRRVPHPQRVF